MDAGGKDFNVTVSRALARGKMKKMAERVSFLPPVSVITPSSDRPPSLDRPFPSLVRPNSMEARPQKRLRINAPLLLPSLLLARPCSRTPGADYNYRAFCFAIRGSPSPVKFRLFFNPLPCVEFRVHPPWIIIRRANGLVQRVYLTIYFIFWQKETRDHLNMVVHMV